jgi:hypothetical protein
MEAADWLWGLLTSLFIGYWGLFATHFYLTTHLHLVLRLIMCGDMSPLHRMPSVLGAEVSTGTTLPTMSFILYFYIIHVIDNLLNFKLLLESQRCKCSIFDYHKLLLLLLLLVLQPAVGFSLLSDSIPFCCLFTLLSPPSYSHYLHIFFDVCNPSLPWSPSSSHTYRFPL